MKPRRSFRAALASMMRGEGLYYALLALLGLVLGLTTLSHRGTDLGTHSHEWPSVFTPSALYACGRGFINTESHLLPELDAFLSGKQEHLAPAHLPETLIEIPRDSFQSLHWHMVVFVGWLWRVFGVSWSSMRWLLAGMLALSGVLAYKVFRLGVNRHLAFLGTLLVMATPTLLHSMHGLRSFSKMPFFLAVIFILGGLIKTPMSTRAYWLRAAVLGTLIGVGAGFRQDMLACLAPGIVVVTTCGRNKPHWAMAERLVALGLLLLTFGLCVWPVLEANREYGTPSHDMVMGMAEFSDELLAIRPASYAKSYAAQDEFIVASINSYARRTLAPDTVLSDVSRDYNRIGFRYVMEMLRTFPADFITRFHAAVLRGVTRFETPHPAWFGWGTDVGDDASAHVHANILGLIAAIVAIAFLFGRSYYHGAAALFLLLYFLGYTCLLYNHLHVYHLGFVPLWCVGFCLTRMLSALRATRRRLRPLRARLDAGRLPAVKRMIVGAVCVSALLLAPLAVARGVQHGQVERLRQRHEAAPLTPLETHVREIDDWVLFSPSTSLGGRRHAYPDTLFQQPWPTPGDYLAARFKSSREPRYFRLCYAFPHFGSDYSWLVRLLPEAHAADGVTRFFFPVHERPSSMGGVVGNHFIGIALPKTEADAFLGLYRVTCADAFPLWPALTLPESSRDFRRRQSLAWRRDVAPAPHGHGPSSWNARDAILATFDSAEETQDLSRLAERLHHLPHDEASYLALVEAYERLAEHAAAIAVYEQAVAAFPRMDIFYIRLDALWRRTLDNFQRAAQWATLASGSTDIADAWYWSGRAAMDIRDVAHAQDAFSRAAKIDPEVAAFHRALGSLLHKTGDIDGALTAYETAAQLAPTDAALQYDTAKALWDAGRREDAIGLLRGILLRLPETAAVAQYLDEVLTAQETACTRVALWREINTAHPNALLPALRLGMALEAAGDMVAAQEAYASAVSILPVQASLLNEKAMAYVKLGEIDQAAACLQKLLLRHPETATAATLLDEILKRDNVMPEKRAAVWRELASKIPMAALPQLHLGMALEAAGALDVALTHYRKAAAAAPDNAPASLRLGALLLLLGENEAGTTYIERALALNHDYAGEAAEAYARRAQQYCADQDYGQAEHWYERASKTFPPMLWHRVGLAETLEVRGLFAEAVEVYWTVLMAAPESPHSAAALDAILAIHFTSDKRTVLWRALVDAHPDARIPREYLQQAVKAKHSS